MIHNFWEIDQSKLSPDQIIKKAKEYFAEDFIENYSMWSEDIKDVNLYVKCTLEDANLPTDKFISLSFDDCCKRIIELITNKINENGEVTTDDIKIISAQLGKELYFQNCLFIENHLFTIKSLKESINKPFMHYN
jgi:protein-arginine kinase